MAFKRHGSAFLEEEALVTLLSGYLEKIFGRLYDTARIPAGPFEKLVMFSVPVGQYQNGRYKLWADTNMLMPGCLPLPMKFIARRLRMERLCGSDRDLDLLACECSVQFRVGLKPYFETPLSSLLLDDWLRSAVAEIGESPAQEIGPYLDKALAHGNLGLTAIAQESLVIESLENFSVFICCDHPIELTNPFVFRVFIEGPEFRGIQ